MVGNLLALTAANIDTAGNVTMTMKGGGCWCSVKDRGGS